jgi:serine/threonine protein kinase
LETGHYNSHSDIFGLGCIIFEVVVGHKLFFSDWAIKTYADAKKALFPDKWPVAQKGSQLYDLGQLTSDLLSVEPRSRPCSVQSRRRLRTLGTESNDLQDPAESASEDLFFFDETSSSVSEGSSGVVQAAL